MLIILILMCVILLFYTITIIVHLYCKKYFVFSNAWGNICAIYKEVKV